MFRIQKPASSYHRPLDPLHARLSNASASPAQSSSSASASQRPASTERRATSRTSNAFASDQLCWAGSRPSRWSTLPTVAHQHGPLELDRGAQCAGRGTCYKCVEEPIETVNKFRCMCLPSPTLAWSQFWWFACWCWSAAAICTIVWDATTPSGRRAAKATMYSRWAMVKWLLLEQGIPAERKVGFEVAKYSRRSGNGAFSDGCSDDKNKIHNITNFNFP